MHRSDHDCSLGSECYDQHIWLQHALGSNKMPITTSSDTVSCINCSSLFTYVSLHNWVQRCRWYQTQFAISRQKEARNKALDTMFRVLPLGVFLESARSKTTTWHDTTDDVQRNIVPASHKAPSQSYDQARESTQFGSPLANHEPCKASAVCKFGFNIIRPIIYGKNNSRTELWADELRGTKRNVACP